jgi:hypothetical protein
VYISTFLVVLCIWGDSKKVEIVFIKKLRATLNQGTPATIRHRTSSNLLPKNIKIKIYRNIILSAVLYGCGTWSLKLREEHWLKVFENRVLRKTFEPKKDECDWRKLDNEELHELYFSTNILRIIKSRRLRRPGGGEGGRVFGMFGGGKCIQGCFGWYT